MNDIDKLFDLLSGKNFQDKDAGALFFPAYIYTYPPEKEYEIRKDIAVLNGKLQRPDNNLDSLLINIYEEIINYLQTKKFIGESLLDQVFNDEKEKPEETEKWLNDIISSKEFYKFLADKINDYFKVHEKRKRVYLLIYGFGSSFPYLRSSTFLKKTEKLVEKFKMILFYPGEYKNKNYHMFGILNDHIDNIYRANLLNNKIIK